jgi:hypothetical protein
VQAPAPVSPPAATQAPPATVSAEELQRLAFSADESVFAGFLEHPEAAEEQVAALASKLTREKVAVLARNPRWLARPSVREALLTNPATPEDVALRCLDHVGTLAALAKVIHDPHVRSLEVKAKAKSRLVERYRTLSVDERVAAVRSTGGRILQDLWNEAFNDRATMVKLVQERGVDDGVVLKIARSRIAPREALMAIGKNSTYLGNYQICLELALNPKTPRELLARIVPKLSPPDRAKLRDSMGVAEYVRTIAKGRS